MKKILIILLTAFILVGIFFYFRIQTLRSQQGQRPPSSISTTSPSPTPYLLQNITPGATTEQELTRTIGKPLRVDTAGGTKTYIYKSGVGNKAINVDLDPNGIVTRTITPVPKGARLDSFFRNLGTADLEMYGTLERLGFRLYVYLQRGVAVLGNPTTQEVVEYWTFQPMSSSAFQEVVAMGYSTTYEENKQ